MFHDDSPVLARVAAKLFKFFDRGFLAAFQRATANL
jgi:hypothetical protein